MEDLELYSRLGHLFLDMRQKPLLTTAAKTAMRGTLDAAKRAVPHLIVHEVASTIVDAAKKRKRVDIDAKHSQEPRSSLPITIIHAERINGTLSV